MENRKILTKMIEVFQLVEEINRKMFVEEYDGLNLSDVHTIEYIGKNRDSNITAISKHMKITKSGTLKIVKKLLERGEIEQYQLPENKKEKYFSLTSNGEKIFEKHERLHREGEERESKIFDKFSLDEKKIIYKFLKTLEADIQEKIKIK